MFQLRDSGGAGAGAGAGEMQSTYCNSEMHIENVQKILATMPCNAKLAASAASDASDIPWLLFLFATWMHLTGRLAKTKRSRTGAGRHCCLPLQVHPAVSVAVAVAEQKSGSVCILIFHFACTQATHLLFTSNRQQIAYTIAMCSSGDCNSIPQTHAAVVNDGWRLRRRHWPPPRLLAPATALVPAACCIPLGVDSETTAAASAAATPGPDADGWRSLSEARHPDR